MNASLARLSALAMLVLLVASIGVLLLTSHQSVRGTEVRAEFREGWPLTEGMAVRMSGAVVGEVKRVELSDRGTAIVVMDIHDGLAPLRRDATAAVRQQDLLGDSYVSLTPGRAAELLRGSISARRTVSMPRFDDVIDVLSPPVRRGVQVVALELARAMDRRGTDLNEAILRLRPGLEAAEDVVGQLSAQNDAIERAIADAQRVTSQVASRTTELDGAVTALALTADEFAGATPQLRRLLADAPEGLRRMRTSLRTTRAVLRAAAPAAAEVRQGADTLTALADAVQALPGTATPVLQDVTSLATQARRTMAAGAPVFERLGRVDYGLLPAGVAGTEFFRILTNDLARGLLGDPQGRGGLFSPFPRTERWPTDPKTDPIRGYVPMYIDLTCELFGRPVAPGCLTGTVATLRALDRGDAGEQNVKARAAGERDARAQAEVLDYLLGP